MCLLSRNDTLNEIIRNKIFNFVLLKYQQTYEKQINLIIIILLRENKNDK